MKRIFKLIVLLITLLTLSSCGKNKNIESYVGSYHGDETHQRVSMKVEKESNTKLSFEVSWANGASEEVVWSFTGESKDNVFDYSDCVKVDRQYKEDGSFEVINTYYKNGSGKIIFKDNNIYWTSDVSDDFLDGQIKLIKNN